jgi:hypothetical protein
MKGVGVYYADLIVRDSLLSWWDAYKAECRKDSVRVDRDGECSYAANPDMIWKNVRKDSIEMGMLDRTVWVDIPGGGKDCGFKVVTVPRYRMVRGKATFDGFMEYLRRKK